MSDKFKSCPFCGEPDEHDNFQFDDEPNGHGICVHCENCGAFGPWANDAEQAAQLWNRRH